MSKTSKISKTRQIITISALSFLLNEASFRKRGLLKLPELIILSN
jgi:hypothetical protein